MYKLLITIFFFGFTSQLLAQDEYGKAILIPNFNNPDKFVNLVNKRAYEVLNNYKNIHIYDWNAETHEVRKINNNNEIGKPISLVRYTNIELSNFNLKPSLELKTDTSGKTLSVQFVLNPYASFLTKTIEVKTSKIVEYSRINPSSSERSSVPNTIIVPKFIEEFGGDPNKIKKANIKEYNKLVDKVTEKFRPIFEERYNEYCRFYASVLASNASDFADESLKSYNVIRNPDDEDEKKVKYITFDGGSKDSLKKNKTLLLYEIVNFENRKTTKFIDGFYVEEVGDNQSKAKMSIWGNKKELAQILKGNTELKLFSNRSAALEYNKSMNKNMTEYNIAVKKNCLFCDYALESILITIPVLNTIERNANELKTFQELAKQDKFIDYNSQELLNKQLGVKYLFYRDAENLMSTDIETGKVLGSEGTYRNSTRTIVKNLFFDTFNKKVEFLKNNEVSKNKVKEIVLYSDFGFANGEDMIIYTTEDEKVGNKTIKRKVTIGEGSVSQTLSDFICIFKVKDGEKELFELQNQKKEFFLEYKIK